MAQTAQMAITKTNKARTPAQRWLLSKHPPALPSYLEKIETYVKREERTGVLWRRDACTNRWLPDLTDPATLGCLLSRVREALGDPACCPAFDGNWYISGSGKGHAYGATEAEALAAALEITP